MGQDLTSTATARTIAQEDAPTVGVTSGGTSLRSTTFARTTVLPRTSAPEDRHPRFEPVRTLGEGGMGEVVLVHDHDIGRRVAVKRLKPGSGEEVAVFRFAEEVRTIGALEHPGIVPIHDVGVDEQGQHYIVMKYVEGETLDAIIDKLRSGDPEYQRRFSFTQRAQIFLALLQALRYAHGRGVIHRDLKPSNVMVGPYGEVMLMDWGIAKRIEHGAKDDTDLALADTSKAQVDARLVETKHGALLGTPLYMSPEQAMGKVRELDERSDVYSACMLFFELMALHHPYEDRKTVQELIVAQVRDELDAFTMHGFLAKHQAFVPAEYLHFLARGLKKDPAARWQSVAEAEQRLEEILDGTFPIQCQVTFAKRVANETVRWADRHAKLYTLILAAVVLALLAALVLGVVALVRG